mmetsp:Transcript_10779/g.23784  ORF Transcript_10779/g.23784 Transcript_10779/m.23784 type:complete len:249 (+) Transcript_10779:58-804(+)
MRALPSNEQRAQHHTAQRKPPQHLGPARHPRCHRRPGPRSDPGTGPTPRGAARARPKPAARAGPWCIRICRALSAAGPQRLVTPPDPSGRWSGLQRQPAQGKSHAKRHGGPPFRPRLQSADARLLGWACGPQIGERPEVPGVPKNQGQLLGTEYHGNPQRWPPRAWSSPAGSQSHRSAPTARWIHPWPLVAGPRSRTLRPPWRKLRPQLLSESHQIIVAYWRHAPEALLEASQLNDPHSGSPNVHPAP